MSKKFFKKNLQAVYVLLFVAAAAGLEAGCGQDKEAIIREKVEERVAVARTKKNGECREGLLLAAGQMADSLLLEEAKAELNDSLARLRPGRPGRPAALPPVDSAAVKPLFGQDSPGRGGR